MGILLTCILVTGCLGMSVSAAKTPLDDATKEAYYAQYVEIAAEVAKEADRDISVLPMEEFTEEDWRTPEEFRSFITEVAYWNLTCTVRDPVQAVSAAGATKTVTITAEGHSCSLAITGSFETAYNEYTKRQQFSGINSITSKLLGSTGTWTQTGYEAASLDAARTYAITVSGKLTIGGAVFPNKLAYAEFYCSAEGGVS